MHRSIVRALFLGAVSAGCIPIPLISPPSRISVTGGATTRSTADNETPSASGAEGTLLFRAELDPLQYMNNSPDRILDSNVGIIVLDLPDSRTAVGGRWGVSAGGSYFAWTQVHENGAATRLLAGGNLNFMIKNEQFGGMGGTAHFDLEYAWRIAPEPFIAGNRGGLIGIAAGELGFALRGELGYFYLQDGLHLYTFTAGICFRIPGTLGFLLVPLH